MRKVERKFTSVEVCAGAGGQAVGLHNAGFQHKALIEIDSHAIKTLNMNVEGNAEWEGCEVIQADLREFSPADLKLAEGELDLLAGGVPCPPFSTAGKQLGEDDERDLFPTMLDFVDFLKPKAVMIENVRGLLQPPHKFRSYRENVIVPRLKAAGYVICGWEVLEACDYGVPQLRPRAILVAMRREYAGYFAWPDPEEIELVTVADALAKSMKQRFGSSAKGRKAYKAWHYQAQRGVAPTLVGGSKKHGGADLGPTRAKRAWGKLGVDGMGVANEPDEMTDEKRDLYRESENGEPFGPKLTVSQAAIIQGFPEEWKFFGRKTAAYRQVGNAFPPPVAQAVGERIVAALEAGLSEPLETEPWSDTLFDLQMPTGAPEPDFADDSRNLEGAGVG